MKSLFDLCQPRRDILDGRFSEADYAASLERVRIGKVSGDYGDPAQFFANTYPTVDLKRLLERVCRRLSAEENGDAAVFRLDTAYGGGKTHGLIALYHAARSGRSVPNIAEFVDPTLLPSSPVRVAPFDGEYADPANGRPMRDGVRAYTPWGELAFLIGGKAAYEIVRQSDEKRVAPGVDTLLEVFSGAPVLIVLDELGEYVRKVRMMEGRDQLTAFLKALLSAVERAPNAALVYTLALRPDGEGVDAFADENKFILRTMDDLASVSARKETILNPTRDDETAAVLRRRLFEHIDDAAAAQVIDAYVDLWSKNRDRLSDEGRRATRERFAACYPFHPDLLDTLTGKTATLERFQRVRGMLRILGRTIQALWTTRPSDAHAIHVHHVDLGQEPIRQEFTSKLGQSAFDPALTHDIAGAGAAVSLAREIDEKSYKGLAPYASYVARTAFVHTMAYHSDLRGLSADHLRFSMAAPALDLAFVDDARTRFVAESAYLDDKPGAPLRFQAEANLTQLVKREMRQVDAGEARAELNDRIKQIFSGATLDLVPFPSGPWDVPDDVADGKPRLALISHEALTVGQDLDNVPDLVRRIFERKGAEGGATRGLRNNVLFLVADEARVAGMREAMVRRLALRELARPQRQAELAEHQKAKVLEDEKRAETEVAIAIQTCFRHLLYPSKASIEDGGPQLAHASIDTQNASEKPGAGQRQVVRQLQEMRKLREAGDDPDSASYIRDRTRLRLGEISTAEFRLEFRKDPALPILLSDEVLRKAILNGIGEGLFIYRSGALMAGPGDPSPSIRFDEESFVMTIESAKSKGLWPRPKPKPPEMGGGGGTTGGGTDGGGGSGGGTEGGTTGGGGGSVPQPEPKPESDVKEAVVRVFEAEAVLSQALAEVFAKARGAKVERLSKVTIRVFDYGDAFRLIALAQLVAGAKKRVTVAGEFETEDASRMEFSFEGAAQDAVQLKDWFEPQLRAAKEKTLDTTIEFAFESGLPLDGDAPETFAKKLTQFGSAAAYVEAVAEAEA